MVSSFEIKHNFKTTAESIYMAWLDSDSHTDMTGGEAECTSEVGDTFSAWDGYITGVNASLTPYSEIIQHWRTSEFADNDPDSTLTIRLKNTPTGCELTLIHSNIPEGQSNYEKGWIEHYFEPMEEYFRDLLLS